MSYDDFLRGVVSLVLASLLAAVALRGRALTRSGLALAWVLAAVIAFCGGITAFLALSAVFLFTVLAGRLAKTDGGSVGERLHAKSGPRDAVQIFCNVFTGALMLLLRALTGMDCFLWAYGGAMAASLADSLASELGVMSKAAPRDILTGKVAEKGLSGAVSLLGLAMSFLGAAIVAGICAFLWDEGSVLMFLSMTAAGVLAALADSALGSALQAKYRCPGCGLLTEKPEHCGLPGTVERGFVWVTNDAVNLCNNLVGAGAAAALSFAFR